MTEAIESASPPRVKRGSAWRAFTPLAFGLLVSVILLTWDAYRHTTIQFRVSIDMGALESLSAKVDGEPFSSGKWVRPGRRKLVINAAGAESIEKEFFLWLGIQDLGEFQLHRSRGSMAINVTPAPLKVVIKGEFLTNSSKSATAKFDAIPIGRYRVTALFRYLIEERQIEVSRNRTAKLVVNAAIGDVSVSSVPSDAEFNLVARTGREIRVEGKTPAVLNQLPVGQYVLQVQRQGYRKELRVDVKTGETNELNVAFEYAELSVATDPAGATIFLNNKEAGETPKTITELRPGRYGLRFEREGFYPVTTAIEVKGNESIVVATNLMSRVYTAAMENARRFGNGVPREYERALASLAEALRVKPEDKEAIELKEKFSRARSEALEQKQAADVVAGRQAVLEKFKKATDGEVDAEFFDIFTWSFETQVDPLKEALLRSLQREPVVWLLKSETKLPGESYLITCTGKGPLGKYRHSSILLAQFAPREVIVHAKFWDYTPRQGQELAFLIRGRESLLPMSPRYASDPSQKAGIEEKRRAMAEEFKTRMQKELN